jgi:methyl-accepting chemotaxis protein
VEQYQMILAIAGAMASFFAFIGAILLAIVGYFIKNFHTEYKTDKITEKLKDKEIDNRMDKIIENFALKIESIVEKISDKINQLPKGSDNLTQVIMQMERDVNKRIDEHSQRIQNNYTRIETVAERLHDLTNAQAGPHLRDQMEKRRVEKLAESEETP